MQKSRKFSRLFCQDQDQDQHSGSQDQDQGKTLLFVLEAPRDQDFGLEDCITDYYKEGSTRYCFCITR